MNMYNCKDLRKIYLSLSLHYSLFSLSQIAIKCGVIQLFVIKCKFTVHGILVETNLRSASMSAALPMSSCLHLGQIWGFNPVLVMEKKFRFYASIQDKADI